jgi:hypothetical protein
MKIDYSNAKTFRQLLAVNIAFLVGYLPESLWHTDIPDPETETIIDSLIVLNSNGFLTVGSQPGVSLKDHKQKGYVEGFVLKKDYRKIMNKAIKKGYLFVFESGKFKKTNIPTEKYNLTKYIHNGAWELYTNMFIDVSFREEYLNFDSTIPAKKILEDECVSVFICTQEYGESVTLF